MEEEINNIYYHQLGEFGGVLRRLNFALGSEYEYPFQPAPLQLPHNFIKSVKLKRGFDREMPIGQQLADVLSIELNLNALSGSSEHGYNSATLRNYILRQQSLNTITVNGEAVYIPNRWFITESTDGGTTWKVTWDGVQERVKQYEFSSDGTHKINVIGMIETVFRNLKIDNISAEVWDRVKNTPAYHVKELIYDRFTQDGNNYAVTVAPNSWLKDNLRFAGAGFTTEFLYQVKTDADNLIKAYRRNSGADNKLEFVYDFLHWMDFFRQDYTTDAAKGSQITNKDDIRIISHIFKNDVGKTLTGGLLPDLDNNVSWAREYKNVFNIFKMLSENFFCKLFYYYVGNEIRACFNPVFDYHIDETGSQAVTPISSPDTLKEYKISYGAEFEQAITHISDLTEYDINEYKTVNDSFGMDEGSYEIKNILHNIRVSPRINNWPEEYKWLFRDSIPDSLKRMPAIEPVVQCLFYFDDSLGMMVRVHEWCAVQIDSTTKISCDALSAGIPNLNSVKIENASRNYYRNFLLERQISSGIGALTAKSANWCFNSRNQGRIEFRAFLDVIPANSLGLCLDIDFSDLLGFTGMPFPPNSPNAIVTALDADMIKNSIDVTAFIRGDYAVH